VIYNAKNGKYEIKEVIGPNEFQVKVDNNFYTNFLAGWTLRYAHKLFYLLRKEHPYKLKLIASKIGLSEMEVNSWKEIAKRIKFIISSDGLIEEFEGYFKRRDIIINEWDGKGMPIWPAEVRLAEVEKTQLVKQADVLLGLYLFSSKFSSKVKKRNFEYYEPRTMHKSSLSIPSYALIALELGELENAYRYFLRLAKTDLADLLSNTKLGIHGGALGGTWQVVVCGFAGVKSKEDRLSINPSLPKAWQRLRFKLRWRGHNFEFRIYKDKTEVFLRTKAKKVRLPIEIYNEIYYIIPNELLTVKK
jgi:kojibiose phosphorylase